MTETSQNETYQYDPSGLRVARHYYYNGTAPDEVEVFTYDVAGRRILTSTCTVLNAGSNTCTLGKNYQRRMNQEEIYFAGRLVGSGGGGAFRDRLGSVRASGNLGWPVNYLPYGEERNTPPTEDGQMKFATYYRDSTIDSQDYANQRYYNSWMGRFNSADPAAGSDPADPSGWNKYAYAGGDPVNEYDPGGTDYFDPNDCSTWVASETWYGGPPCGYNQWGAVFGNISGIAGCGGVGPSQFNPGVGMACLAMAAPVLLAPPPVLNCGESLAVTGVFPTSSTGHDLSDVLLGENSWSKIGSQQYQNGDAYGHPTGLTITAGTVGREDNLMLDVIANLASAKDVSLSREASSGAFLGYGAGQTKFSSYLTSAVGSSSCNDLTEVSLAVDSFTAGGSVARSSYNQWRGVVQRNPKTGKFFARHQNPGDVRAGATDFFTVTNP